MEATELYFTMKIYAMLALAGLFVLCILAWVVCYAVGCFKEKRKEKQWLQNKSRTRINSKSE